MGSKAMSITDGEWEIMESVWQAVEQTPAAILARVDAGNRSHRTLRTMLARLVDKGAVKVRIDGTRHLYSAALTRGECIRSATKSFTQQFFAGDLKSLLLHFVEEETLTKAEILELQEKLSQLSKNKKSKR